MRRLALFLALVCAAPAYAQTRVDVPAGDVTLPGLLHRPEGAGPFPAIVAMHGCAGMFARNGSVNARDADWTRRLGAEGYVVLQIDSFGARGLRETCTMRDPPVRPERQRAADAHEARRYLRNLAYVRGDRIGLMGWSNGAMAALNAIDAHNPGRNAAGPSDDFAAAIAFYPGCVALRDKLPAWRGTVPLLMLLGELDNWTRPGPCQTLAARARTISAPIETVVYPGAHHDFDAPDTPPRERRNVGSVTGGTVTIGTNPEARADALVRAPAYFERHLKR
jgi:dienelactone hydrolase